MSLEDRLFNELNKRKAKDNLRSLSITEGLVDFVSNDYLGLSRSQTLHKRIAEQLEKVKINGSTGSRLLSGNSNLIEEVESELSEVFNVENTLLFNSGYLANLGVLSSIPRRGDTIIYDELAHACIKDGARLSLANRFSFKHNDLIDLERKLKAAEGNIFVVVESIYSMDGDLCPLKGLVELSDRYNAKIIIDEAHGTGVLGENGSGASGQFGSEKIFCRIYTFGKAMGIHGAAVCGSKLLTDYLVNFSRPFIYTTAPSPHSVISVQQAFRFLQENIQLQDEINIKVDHFISEYKSNLFGLLERTNSKHPIQGLIIPGNKRVKGLANELKKEGYDVRPILSPTVREGQERLRICLHTYNTNEEISSLIKDIKHCYELFYYGHRN